MRSLQTSASGPVLVWGSGQSQIPAIREADAETSEDMIARVEAARGGSWELTGERWIVVVNASDEALDLDPATRGYSREALRSTT